MPSPTPSSTPTATATPTSVSSAACRQLSVPEVLRAIFRRWSEPWDPALACAPGAGPSQLYRDLGTTPGPLPLSAQALAQIEADACYNAQFGQCAQLRREGASVLPWVRALQASGLAPQHLFVPY